MSQQDKPDVPHTPDSRASASPEEVIFDGNVSWVGRLGAFFWTYLIALLLIVVPVGIRIGLSANEPWWVMAAGAVLAALLIVGQSLYHSTIRFRITNYRIDYERGTLTRKIDSLELWYIDHINFRQTLLERLAGVGTIEVVTDDPRAKDLKLLSLPHAREVFEKLKSSILIAKRQRGLIELDQQ